MVDWTVLNLLVSDPPRIQLVCLVLHGSGNWRFAKHIQTYPDISRLQLISSNNIKQYQTPRYPAGGSQGKRRTPGTHPKMRHWEVAWMQNIKVKRERLTWSYVKLCEAMWSLKHLERSWKCEKMDWQHGFSCWFLDGFCTLCDTRVHVLKILGMILGCLRCVWL